MAKYRWVPADDVVLILAVRHQREAGYKEEWRPFRDFDRFAVTIW